MLRCQCDCEGGGAKHGHEHNQVYFRGTMGPIDRQAKHGHEHDQAYFRGTMGPIDRHSDKKIEVIQGFHILSGSPKNNLNFKGYPKMV